MYNSRNRNFDFFFLINKGSALRELNLCKVWDFEHVLDTMAVKICTALRALGSLHARLHGTSVESPVSTR